MSPLRLLAAVKPRVLFGIPSLRNDLPYTFVFHQQHHFDEMTENGTKVNRSRMS
jgi:hypothetical protein